MADSDGQDANTIVSRLKKHGGRYSFFQTARLFLKQCKDGLVKKKLLFRPALTFSRPRSEVVAINESEDTIQVDVNVPGLYGASSPLPRFYTEELIYAGQEDQPFAREMIDIFHARYYEILVEAELKYKPFVRETDFSDAGVSHLLTTLVGSSLDDLDSTVARRLLPYISLFAPFRRSAEGLTLLLSGLYPGVKFEVKEHIFKRMFIDDKELTALGVNNHVLGQSMLLGDFVEIENCSIRIDIGPIDLDGYKNIISGHGEWQFLKPVIEAYCTAAVSIDLRVALEDAKAQPVQLGGEQAPCLGLSAWLLNAQGKTDFATHIPLTKTG